MQLSWWAATEPKGTNLAVTKNSLWIAALNLPGGYPSPLRIWNSSRSIPGKPEATCCLRIQMADLTN
jgi:hypothetical protein